MGDLLWPGDERAGEHLTGACVVAAMVEVEVAWLELLAGQGVAAAGSTALADVRLDAAEVAAVAEGAATSGTPVLGLVRLLRERLAADPVAATWLHRGLTSQDVLDTALVLCARRAVVELRAELERQVALLSALASGHRDTAMVARTLTQHAVPTTFGLKAARWLAGVLDALEAVAALRFPVQLGGAAGTMAAALELGLDARAAREDLAARLGLEPAPPWHTTRAPVTRLGDALVGCTDAWGHLSADVLALSRPEVGELTEGSGGGSSTMPHKANPVRSVLVRRTALSTPQLAATLHLAAADQVDERAVGGWHAEGATLRDLVRRTLAAGSLVTELVGGLVVHADRMAATLETARHDVHAEQRSLAELAGHEPTGDYLGAAGALVDEVLERVRRR